MQLFHEQAQFKNTFAEECSIHDLGIFSVVVQLRTWITAPIAMDAPLNYLTVMGKLMVYPQGPNYYNFCSNKQRARDSSLVSFIGLAPFDSRVYSDSKKCTIAAIEEILSPDYLSEKRPSIKYVTLEGGGGPRRCDSL